MTDGQPDKNGYISDGYYLKARCIQNSEIAHTSPYIREIWDWLIREANHNDRRLNGNVIRRGQCLTRFKDIQEGLSWFIGFRKMKYRKWQVEKAIRWLSDHNMIESQKTTRGMLINIVKYCYFQDPKNYGLRNLNESDNESNTDSNTLPVDKTSTKATTIATMEQQGTDTIHNELNKLKKEKPSNGNLTAYLPLSLAFHEKQKTGGRQHQDFKQTLTENSRVVVAGAETIEKLQRTDGESIKDIQAVLDFILHDGFWANQVASLSSLRRKSRNGLLKYFNVKNSMQQPGKTESKPNGWDLCR